MLKFRHGTKDYVGVARNASQKSFASADKKFIALTGDIADLRNDMATKDDVRVILREELKPIETRLTAVESKVAGIDRRLDADAMGRDDEKLPTRVDKIEKHLGLDKQVRI